MTKDPSVARCDGLFSKLVRSAGMCAECGETDPLKLQCAHGFSRVYRTVRWDERNAFALCKSCHFYYTHRPIEWEDWLRAEWGDDLYAELRALAMQTSVKTDRRDVSERLRGRLAEVEAA